MKITTARRLAHGATAIWVVLLAVLFLTTSGMAQPAPAPAASAVDPCAAKGRHWEFDARLGRCSKNEASMAAERKGRPCRSQVPARWGACVATSATPALVAGGRTPVLADGESITLQDARKPWIGEVTRVCVGGLIKDSRTAEGIRLRGNCYVPGLAASAPQ